MQWAERFFTAFSRVALGLLIAWACAPNVADAQRSPSSSRSLRAPVQRSAPSSRAFRSPARSAPNRTFSAPNRNASSSGARELGQRIGSRLGSARSGGSNTPILDALLGNRGDNAKDGLGTLGDIFRNNRYDRDYDDDNEYADAYLAVGLANAAVGLISVLAENNRYRYGPGGYYAPANHYGDGCPYCRAEASYAPQPQQRLVTERVLVEEGRYEQYQVWIPERYDSNTGRKLGGGFHETRTRYIPPQYEYREVAAGY